MKKNLLWSILVQLACTVVVMGGISAADVERLGKDLTPLGGEKAGNADGSIPPWTGGITEPPPGYSPGQHHPDPFKDDSIKFTITASNAAQYGDKLSAGHLA